MDPTRPPIVVQATYALLSPELISTYNGKTVILGDNECPHHFLSPRFPRLHWPATPRMMAGGVNGGPLMIARERRRFYSQELTSLPDPRPVCPYPPNYYRL